MLKKLLHAAIITLLLNITLAITSSNTVQSKTVPPIDPTSESIVSLFVRALK